MLLKSGADASIKNAAGKTALGLATKEDVKALLRAGAPASSTPSGPVPAEFIKVLAAVGLSQFGPRFVSELGMSSAGDAKFLTDDHLATIGLKPLERARLLAQIQQM